MSLFLLLTSAFDGIYREIKHFLSSPAETDTVYERKKCYADMMLQPAVCFFYFEGISTGNTFINLPGRLTRSAGRGKRQRDVQRAFSSADERGSTERRRPDGGDRCLGAPQPGSPGEGRAWVSSERGDQLAAETVQNFSPVCCSQHGVLVGVMTQ